MINKAVGYSGFRTYGQLPYPTLKQGKELQLTNQIWSSTVRPTDHTNPLQNFHTNKTIYTKSYIQNTFPQHYHPEHVPKGGHRTLAFQGTGTIKAYDREEALKYGGAAVWKEGDDPRKASLLRTGTEHWRSVYQQSISNPNQAGINGNSGLAYRTGYGNNNNNGQGNNADPQASNPQTSPNPDQSNPLNTRSQSLGGKTKAQLAQQLARQNSYKTKPYMNNAKTGITDYKFNYGEKIGDSPFDLMNMVSVKQPVRDHPLKRGTNQLWTQIPNYQGFKPSELSFKEYQERLRNRGEVDKGNLKLQTAQNFLVQTPGYGGFKPQFQKTATQLRQSCLSTKFGS